MRTNNITNIFNSFLFLTLLVCPALLSFGQQVSEAARYSQNLYGGSARVVGTGGAYGAIGADFGGLSINPAGLGFYRHSELSLTPSLQMYNNENRHFNSQSNERGMRFALSNIGWVSNLNRSRRNKTTGLVTASMALGINRLNNYSDQNYIDGINDRSAVTYAEKLSSDPDFPSLTPIVLGNSLVRQRETRSVRGGMNEAVFALGFNHSNKIYFGAQLGIPYFVYDYESQYVEDDYEGNVNNFEQLDYQDRLKTTGVGVNGKFGLIYRPDEALRFGLAFHTPSLMQMEDQFSDGGTVTQDSEDGIVSTVDISNPNYPGNFIYALRTPSKWVASAAYFPGNKGFISVDYEFVNYAKARFDNSFNDADIYNQGFFTDLNNDIDRDLRAASNIKIGLEYAPKMLRLRAGYAFMGSPIATQSLRANNHILSGGIGLRAKRVLLDFAYSTSLRNYDYQLYEFASTTDIKNRQEQLLLTLGFRL